MQLVLNVRKEENYLIIWRGLSTTKGGFHYLSHRDVNFANMGITELTFFFLHFAACVLEQSFLCSLHMVQPQKQPVSHW